MSDASPLPFDDACGRIPAWSTSPPTRYKWKNAEPPGLQFPTKMLWIYVVLCDDRPRSANPCQSMENHMKKMRIAINLALALTLCVAAYGLGVPAVSQAQTGTEQNAQDAVAAPADIYRKNCATCHDRAVMGAPKPGDPRFSADLDTLVENAIKGIGRMPARGHASFLTDDEIRSVVEYMRDPSNQ